jgi:transposase
MSKFYPSLFQAANNIETHSWFDIKNRKNESFNKKKRKRHINYKYIDTIKIVLNLTDKQKKIINMWTDDCIDIYNSVNKYIKENAPNKNCKKFINYYSLREKMNEMLYNVCERHRLNKHTADYALKHCVEMYKSALSNHKNDMSKFNIRDLAKDRRRKNLIVEPSSISKRENSIFIRELGVIKSNISLKIISQNSVLQYDSFKNKYIIITPKKVNKENYVEQYHKCGIDIGVRTFLTTYSRSDSNEIGTNTYKTIDMVNKRLDHIRKSKDEKVITERKFTNLYNKYSSKLKNKINDLHFKSANYLLSRYRKLFIGKVSIKKMISNLDGNLREITKRRLMALSHYRFRMKLKQMAKKFECKIFETDEYLTSKTCSRCKFINDNLKGNKIYDCPNCKLKIDRDINASINIYKNRTLTRSGPLKKVENSLVL